MNKLFTHPDEVQIPGGETFRQVKERASQAIEKLVVKHPDETIAVVSHGGTIRTILCAILDIHLNHVWNIVQDNTAVNIINYYSERTMVSLVNDTHHLLPK
jgi:alpha-ribazole phosphatase